MLRRTAMIVTLMLGSSVVGAMPASAAFVTQDQEQPDHSGPVLSGGDSLLAQTFTAGVDGQLTAIELYVASPATGVQVELRDALIHEDDPALATTTISTDATGWVRIPLGPVRLDAGSRYAIVTDGQLNFGAAASGAGSPEAYPGGVAWTIMQGSWIPIPLDLAFRTYMRVKPGAFEWVKAPARPRAGADAGCRFSLGGWYGADVLRGGSPTTTRVRCADGTRIDGTTFRTRPLGGELSYDPATETYAVTWHVRAAWARGALACRTFEVWVRGDDTPERVTVRVRPPIEH